MDLKGAEVRNFYKLSSNIGVNDETVGVIRIPHYQRPYKWDRSLVKQLIDDWGLENAKSKDSEYFAGSIVTVSNTQTEQLVHQLIDGQQRFTTIYLTNFLLFLLLRVTLREAVSGKQQLAITGLLEKLELSVKFSITKELTDILNIDDIGDAFQSVDQDSQEKIQGILEKYCAVMHLPDVPESNEKYREVYINKLEKYLAEYSPRLSYDRDSYNKSLCNALSRIVIKCDSQHPVSIYIDKNKLKEGCIELVYLEAAQQIFDSFQENAKNVLDNKQGVFKYSLAIIDSAIAFLKSVKLCVIQTGNQEDAYTLFEVLNDRSLALDDLDLVKNQFYRFLCISSKNTNISDEDLDKEIVAREKQWGDDVFKNNSDTNKKLIAYLATSYITGSIKIEKSHDNLRDNIKNYLEEYKEKYSCDNLKIDFNIFESIRMFISEFDVYANNRSVRALEAEFSLDKTDTYKTVHLLLALNFDGVLAGLTNFILQYININKNISDFEPSKVSLVLKELVNDKTTNMDVHKQAKSIWQIALLSSDHKKPKELANNLITTNFKKITTLNTQSPSLGKEAISDWLNPWRYSSSDVKVKILFARLLQIDLDANELLIKSTFSSSIQKDDIQKLHFDHMEPTNPNTVNPNDYYKFGQIDRVDDVNALGNMFPLPGSENISKSNDPMYTAFDHIKSSGLGNHWLTVKTEDIFKSNCTDVNGKKVPTQNFFVKRKQFLIDKFYSAIIL